MPDHGHGPAESWSAEDEIRLIDRLASVLELDVLIATNERVVLSSEEARELAGRSVASMRACGIDISLTDGHG